jgi:flavin-dependent dehydrogenase
MMTFDIGVIGAGPAGVTVALSLVRQGYRVGLIGKPRHLPAIEGLSERAMNGLRFIGCQQALAQIGPLVPRLASWNGEPFSGNREWIVERGRFDAALCDDARTGGVTCLEDHVTTLQRQAGGWLLMVAGHGELTAGFVIDARGRTAPHRSDRRQRGPLTIALGRVWALPVHTPAATRVATFSDGWLWFASTGNGGGILQVFVSAETESLPPRSGLEAHYQRLLADCPATREWLAGARPQGTVFARQAHPQFAGDLVSSGYARVGDAAFAIDPLSGHGIYEAVGGALTLAATINTILARPQDADLALAFYQERIEHDFQRLCRIGRDFYRQEQRWPERPFWRERQSWPDDQPAHRPRADQPAHIESRPVNADGFITRQEVVVTADQPRGVWQVAGIALVPFLRFLRTHSGENLGTLLDDYAVRQRVGVEDCRTALAWLASRRLFSLTAVPARENDRPFPDTAAGPPASPADARPDEPPAGR